jgi:hypothetical protein
MGRHGPDPREIMGECRNLPESRAFMARVTADLRGIPVLRGRGLRNISEFSGNHGKNFKAQDDTIFSINLTDYC